MIEEETKDKETDATVLGDIVPSCLSTCVVHLENNFAECTIVWFSKCTRAVHKNMYTAR